MAGFFDVVDLQKHCSFGNRYGFGLSGIQVSYHRCEHCGFLFTGFFDTWSTEEFGRYIYNDDYVQVDPEYKGARPSRIAGIMAKLLRGCEALRILDYGSGSGVFAAEMRAAGFAGIEAFDPFSNPRRPDGLFDLVTCFEVLEHMAWPSKAVEDMQSMLAPGGCLVFSQSVQPPDIADIRGAWWYLAPRNGHISMFTIDTLHRLLPSDRHVLHGNGWLWAMAPVRPHPLLAPCMAAIGPAIVSVSLHAPASGADESWHPAEMSAAGTFRWSSSDTLQWRLPAPPCVPAQMKLRVPFNLEIEPGFAAGCAVEIAGVAAKVVVSDRNIQAEAAIRCDAPFVVATLRTPPLRSPFDVRGTLDGRRLGLGVLIG
jgi:2-polyprenyl-6-hydroxyphenyl methylase/3-demethylubiquinone-9 3-methyltransferase